MVIVGVWKLKIKKIKVNRILINNTKNGKCNKDNKSKNILFYALMSMGSNF